MTTFFLAMLLHPEVQQKAREEIDRVVGEGRLPNVKDRDNLPYIEAVLRESFRFHPIAPMGLPHEVTEDDVYQGYLIPKGAIIMPNIWFVPSLFHSTFHTFILQTPTTPQAQTRLTSNADQR